MDVVRIRAEAEAEHEREVLVQVCLGDYDHGVIPVDAEDLLADSLDLKFDEV